MTDDEHALVDLDLWAAGLCPIREEPEESVDDGASICPRCSQYCFKRYDVGGVLVCGYCRDVQHHAEQAT
jgi:hypothetical protein